MEIGLPAIIFVVWIVISVAQSFKKQAEIKRAKLQDPQSKPGELPEKTRQMLDGDGENPIREARPRSAQRRQRPPAPAQELIESLFGVQTAPAETEETAEEGEWAPVPPAPRQEMPRRPQQRAVPPPVRRRETVPHSHERPVLHRAQSRTPSEYEQREARKLKENRDQEAQNRQREKQLKQPQKAQEQALKRKAAQLKRATARPVTSRRRRGRLFQGIQDVRKAIVFAEILGPPKGLQNL